MLQRLARKLSNWKYLALAGAIQAAPACTAMTETEDFPENNWKVPATTKVLSPDELKEEQPQTGEYGQTIYFDKSSSFARNLSRDDIIIAGTSPQFPDGLLRKTISIEQQRDAITVTTEQATLEEAIEQGRFDARLNLADAYQQAELREDGLETRTQNLLIEATGEAGLRIIFEKYEITPGITIGGELFLEPRINVMADIGLFTLREAAVSVEGTEDLTIEVETAYRTSIKRDSPQQTLARLKPLTFMTPAGPIVITPVLSIGYGTEAEAEFSIKGTLHQRINAEIGLSYKKAREPAWEPIARFDHTFEFLYPETPTLRGKVESYAKPRLSFLLYGVAGPNVSLKGALGAQAGLDERNRPAVGIYTTLGVNLGIEVKALSATLADYEVEVYSARRDLKKIELGGGPGGDQCDGRTNRCSADKRQVEVYDGCDKLVDRVECRSIGENYQCEGGECLEQMVEEPAEGEGEEPAEGEGEELEEQISNLIFVRKIPLVHIVNGIEYEPISVHSMASDGRSFWYVLQRREQDDANTDVDICTLDLRTGRTERCLAPYDTGSFFPDMSLAYANGQMYWFKGGESTLDFSIINLRDGSKRNLGRFPFSQDYRLISLSSYNNHLFMYRVPTMSLDTQFCAIELPTELVCGEGRPSSFVPNVIQIAEDRYLAIGSRLVMIKGNYSEGVAEEIEQLRVRDRCGEQMLAVGETSTKVEDKIYIGCVPEPVGEDVGKRAHILEYQAE